MYSREILTLNGKNEKLYKLIFNNMFIVYSIVPSDRGSKKASYYYYKIYIHKYLRSTCRRDLQRVPKNMRIGRRLNDLKQTF